jgi:hypothetical protein
MKSVYIDEFGFTMILTPEEVKTLSKESNDIFIEEDEDNDDNSFEIIYDNDK